MGRSVGIDLGTTNSCVAVIEGGRPVVIPNAEGSTTTPSVVAFGKDGQIAVGAKARRQAAVYPDRTIYGVKRLIGQRYAVEEVQQLARLLPYRVVAASNGDAAVQIDDRVYTPQEISAYVLESIKASAEAYLDDHIDEAVITVPAYFNDAQRQATRDAGRIAGLDVRRIINEPTAAALAHGAGKRVDRGLWVVFDLGGGTFDVSVLQCEGDVFEVLATAGDTMLGGMDFDNVLFEDIVGELTRTSGVDISQNPVCVQRVREAVESARCALSETDETQINLPYLTASSKGPIHLVRSLTRAHVEQVTAPLLKKLEEPTLDALQQARVRPEQLDMVLLVGGMTRTPSVRQVAQRLLGRTPAKGINPDEIVALGAAWQSACTRGEVDEVLLLDVTPQALGIATRNGRFSELIPKNRSVPTEERKHFATTEKNQEFVSIDIYQGDSPLVANNTLLGRFILDDLPRGEAGEVRVEVGFNIDVNGILHVSARHEKSGREARITVRANSGLSPLEVERLIEERRGAGKGALRER